MKTYLVKKDVNKPDSQDNWIIMTGYEFARFMETEEGKKRKNNFAKLDRCDERDDAIIIECGKEKAKEWECERLRELYHVCSKLKYPTISFDSYMPGKGNYYCDDVIADITVDVEGAVILECELEYLHQALSLLSETERELIQQFYLIDETLTEKEYAIRCGICQSSAHERKMRVLAKLKNHLGNFGFGADYFD